MSIAPSSRQAKRREGRWHEQPHATLHARSIRRLVLVVDDDRNTRETLAVLLALSGHVVRLAGSGDDAVRAAEEFRPDVVFLDIRMHEGDGGYATCRRLRSNPALRGCRIYALSALSGREHERECMNAGFTGQFVKPLDPSALARIL